MEKNTSERLLSLDALRGFDMFWIIGGEWLVHTLKDYTGLPWLVWLSGQFEHAEWNGFHMYDLIFPLFLFLSGVTMPYSLTRQLEKGVPKKKIYLKIFRRAALLVFFGIIYNGLGDWHFANIRFASVLGQIGIAYLLAALIFLNSDWKQQIYWILGILLGYWMIQSLIPVPGYGAGNLTKEGSINGFIDRILLPGRLYLGIHDPEGWLVKIPATATALLGALTGFFIKSEFTTGLKKVLYMYAAGIALLVLSLIWNLVLPINKNLWTSSFTLHTAGWSILLLSLFYLIIDISKIKKWSFFFTVIGMNSIIIYLLTALLDFSYTTKYLFGGLIGFADKGLQPFLTSLIIILVEWSLLLFLYKKKIFFKV
jgi:predicted acyltransferase